MSLNYVDLTIDLHDGQGNALAEGLLSFTPSTQLTDTDASDHGVTTVAAVTIDLSETTAVSLLATDNATPLPSGWGWTVSFSGVPGSPAPFSFFLPYAAGATQYLSSLTQLPAGATAVLDQSAQAILAEG